MNDVYALTAVNIASLNMRIFNRWGQLVNELTRVGEVWDARSLSGSLVPDGTYFYMLEAKGLDGRSYDQSGHLTVLR
jgi:gliding motility-associated-like protein